MGPGSAISPFLMVEGACRKQGAARGGDIAALWRDENLHDSASTEIMTSVLADRQ